MKFSCVCMPQGIFHDHYITSTHITPTSGRNSISHTMETLTGNDSVGEEGTYQLVHALTVNTSITRGCGLLPPKRCEEYPTQCEVHRTVRMKLIRLHDIVI